MPTFLLTLLTDWRVWGAVGIVAGALWLHHSGAESVRQEIAVANAKAEQIQRSEETRRLNEQERLKNEHAKEKAKLVADAARADAALLGLRNAIAARGTGADPATAGRSEAGDPVGELLGQCASEYRHMARQADVAHAAGTLCEKSYDTLTPTPSTVRDRIRANLKGK